MALAGMAASSPPPIRLEAEPVGQAMRFQVVGEADRPLAARFTLHVESGAGNRSQNAGTARLVPGQRAVLTTVTVSLNGQPWRATLRVEPEGAAPYEQALRGD